MKRTTTGNENRLFHLIPLAILILFILILYFSDYAYDLSFQNIQNQHLYWKEYAHEHPVLSALYFVCIYVLSVVLIIPDSTILTLLAGFLFPFPLALLYAVCAETLGAFLFFWIMRTAFASAALPNIMKLKEKLKKEDVCYLLFFRLSHLIPFWLVNAAAGVFRIRPWTFIWTTLVGILPLSLVLVQGGKDLSKYFETHTHFSMKEVFTPEVKLILLVLGCLALFPIVYQRLSKKD
jgi:uncharacterized membrane protein YdjX (TVP38/TMEM64 family)